MNLKTCTCGHKVTTKNSINLARNEMGLWFTCSECKTTLFIRAKKLPQIKTTLADV
jgi:predicted SprT family Zn-dependent metalloprotease